MHRMLSVILIAALAACSLLSVPQAQAESMVGLNAVAVSGKQRMLSQRVLKAYAQGQLGVMPEKAAAILTTSLAELKANNTALQSGAKGPTLVALEAQMALINKLGSSTSRAADPAAVQQTALISEDLLNNAETVTQAFIKSGAEAPAALANLAARQRMLSQRAAAAYFVYEAGNKSVLFKERGQKAASDFKAAISAFEDSKTEFPKISERIEMARIQMIFFDNAVSSAHQPTKEQLTTIATTSERILQEMDAMTSDIVKQLSARDAPASIKK
jgi:Type IV pili methyl-accepting chemotaxis transducer N-term